jgi:hypothetical protein
VFLPGDTVGSPARCVNISILNDEIVEATEMFDVVFSSDSILQIIGATSVPVTINEDPTDCEPLCYSLKKERVTRVPSKYKFMRGSGRGNTCMSKA